MGTSRELFLSKFSDEDLHGCPVFLRDLTIGMDVLNIKTTEIFGKEYDSDLSAKCVKAFRDFCGQDAVVGCIHSVAFNMDAFGGKTKYPEWGIPVPSEHPFENFVDVPGVPEISGMYLGALRSYRKVRETIPDAAVVLNVEGPMTKTGTLTGMDTLAIYSENEKDLLDKMIEVSTIHTENWIEKISSEGLVDAVFLASATDNPDLFGIDSFQRYSIKWTEELVRISHKFGLPVIFHPHGIFDSDPGLMEMSLNTGIDGFQYAEFNDPAKISSKIDERCCVMGGTDITPTLLNGSEEDIVSETTHHIDACFGQRYVFMGSCSLHRGIPLSSVKIMTDCVKDYNKKCYDHSDL